MPSVAETVPRLTELCGKHDVLKCTTGNGKWVPFIVVSQLFIYIPQNGVVHKIHCKKNYFNKRKSIYLK